jgi:hypothetical protein
MLNMYRFFFAMVCLLSSAAHAQDDLERLGDWMSHYYENPQPDNFTKWIKDISELGVFEKSSARLPLLIFVSEVIKQNPNKADKWCTNLASLSAPNKAPIGWSFFNSGVPIANNCVQTKLRLEENDVKNILGSDRYNPLETDPSSPADLDMLWALFSATGSEVAVNRIIDVLGKPLPKEGTPGRLDVMMLKGAAEWSLASNIQQHRRVADITKVRRKGESGDFAKKIDDVLSRASQKND